MNRIAARLLWLLVLTLVACSAESDNPQHTFRTYMEHGVTISQSSGGPRFSEPLFRFDEVLELHQDETRPETLINKTFHYRIDDDGRVFVFDHGDCRILIFDSEGEYLKSFGRSGAGPGEFYFPRPLWMRNGLIAIFDQQQTRTTLFTTEGILVDTYSVYSQTRFPIGQPMRMVSEIHPLAESRLLILGSVTNGLGTEDHAILSTAYVLSPQSDTLSTFESNWHKYPQKPSKRGGVVLERVIYDSQSRVQYYSGRGILISDGAEPVLRWYALNGSLHSIHELGLEPVPVTDSEKTIIQRRLRERARGDARLEEDVDHTQFPEFKTYWEDIEVDDYGFIWLRECPDLTQPWPITAPFSYKIFSPEGEYLGVVARPSKVGVLSQGHFITRHSNPETGDVRHVIYNIVPAVDGLKYR